MIKILFVCHGNICRSPTAKFVMDYIVEKDGLSDKIQSSSAALSYEAVGNPIYHKAQAVLQKNGIPYSHHSAKKIKRTAYNEFDYIIGMDDKNLHSLHRLFPKDSQGKIHLILDFSPTPHPVADPWYSGDFDTAFDDICTGCKYLLENIKENYKI